jgi:predicted DNA-binding transcriptional regulator AlpA
MVFMKDSNSRYVPASLPESGFVRLPAILAHFPVSRSSWWAGIRSGRYPRPVKLGPRISAWRVEDIKALIEDPEQWQRISQSTPATRPARRGAVTAKANEVEKFHDR